MPQLAAPWSAQSLSGSVPAAIAPHVPSLPLPLRTAEQAWQAAAQDVLQQTLSTQELELHWLAELQAAPLPNFGTQAPPEQKWPLMQSESPAQELLQTLGPQT